MLAMNAETSLDRCEHSSVLAQAGPQKLFMVTKIVLTLGTFLPDVS